MNTRLVDRSSKSGWLWPIFEHNKLRATLGKAHDMADITLETALELLAAKLAKGSNTKKATAKKAKKKAAPKKTPAKKAVTKKAGS